MSLQSDVPTPVRPLTSLKRKFTMKMKGQSPAARMLERELTKNSATAMPKRWNSLILKAAFPQVWTRRTTRRLSTIC